MSDITNRQGQEVLLKIVSACRDMGLNDDQIITAISSSLVAFVASKNIEYIKVELDRVGSCEINTIDNITGISNV
ncbi:MAG: hypothetical protein CMB99_02870 [Flavobacteriaceae bacterium]|nr:hypothetical protein [Flavobacteriaceae bacterium]|tara:strand:+ start:1421 stop:1645 length:225 start_codon:yes stop_codon:yes gene_type:complete